MMSQNRPSAAHRNVVPHEANAEGKRLCSHAKTLCLTAAVIFISAPAFVHAQSAPWTGTFAVAPMRGESSVQLSGVTLRQIVHTSAAGKQLRIQFSNLYGTQPLRIEDAHIAFSHGGSSIVASSDHAVRFNSQSSVVIPPGSTVSCDTVPMATPALADLAISFYLPSQSGPVTLHPDAHRTNYIAAGDVSAQADLPDAKHTNSIYFLTSVDVQDDPLRGAVVTFGASITEGYAATQNTTRRWPDMLAQRLAQAGLAIGVLNTAISGNRLLTEGAGPDAETRFERDVLDQPNVRWVIFSDDPINDLGSTRPAPTATALIAATQRLIAKAHAKDIRFFCSTLTPYQGANYWRTEDEPAREQFNAFVRSSASGCDGVLDQDAATHDPDKPTWFLPAYDSGDHLHPNDAGHKAIADSIDLSLFSR